MRYGVATLVFALMLLAAIALAGAGHGWIAGAFGCAVLAPLSFLTVVNGLARAPWFRGAVALLAVGVIVCLGVGVATAAGGSEYLLRYMQVNGVAGMLVAASAYVGWTVIASLAAVRARRVLQNGT